VPPDVDAVIAMAMASDPLERYASAYAMLGDVRRLLGGRTPKLRNSLAPVPSQSFADTPVAVVVPGVTATPAPASWSSEALPPAPQASAQPRSEWLGNLLLVLAIALLVGLATFVLVRERLADTPRLSHATTSQPASWRSTRG
jgi:hypothetical protein